MALCKTDMMNAIYKLVSVALLGPLSASASSQAPPHPKSLNNTAGIVCLKLADNGTISDSFGIVSAGSKRKDRDLLAWANLHKWPATKKPGEVRNEWFAMAVVTGTASPPKEMPSCEQAAAQRSAVPVR